MTGLGRIRPAIADSLEELVGDTPLVRVSLPGLADGVRLLAKMETFNPMFNVKDRAAASMLREAQERGLLPERGGIVIECSSGSTGISLAAFCAARGHRCVIVMPDNATEERRRILEEYGAEVVLVPAADGLLSAWRFAEGLRDRTPGAYLVHQDQNEANVRAHYETTGPEIWQATGHDVDVFVCGVGTGGTLTGVARYLKERRDVHVVAVEPERSAVMSGKDAGPHGIAGIGAGYVSDITDMSLVDEIVVVPDAAAMRVKRELSRRSGLLVGVSSGAAAYACGQVAARWAGATVVTVFPDTGERYLSVRPEETRAEPEIVSARHGIHQRS
ncbi:PLP-dependent cysteine synthase family protein [Actinoplanes sp. NPDC051494]|uniref:PLP-dependent cysteine synthase family protein n=1 Tax=Actinoplanes sp. NPDC051494 TaxID=3363907 RepID=UPI0037B60333